MLKKLVRKLQSLEGNRSTFDPASLGDSIAMQTDWSPAKSGGANFRTHKLVEINSSRLEFRASIGSTGVHMTPSQNVAPARHIASTSVIERRSNRS